MQWRGEAKAIVKLKPTHFFLVFLLRNEVSLIFWYWTSISPLALSPQNILSLAP